MRGEVYALKDMPGRRGSEQRGHRYAVVVQSDDLWISTVMVAPTSTSARPFAHRPTIRVMDVQTCVLVEQSQPIVYERLGPRVGVVTLAEMQDIDVALRLVMGLR